MEQMYLVEIFIDKVTIFATDDDEGSSNKNLIIKIQFGPKVQFIIKEGQLAVNDERKDDIIECDENGRRQWTRTIRVGKSYLFPSYSDTVLMILSKFPLEIEVWTDDENEVEIFVGVGNMHWDTQFFFMLKETTDACMIHEPLSIKSKTTLYAECCCKQVGEIHFILRLSALGDSIITEFQQLLKDPESFVFRTNKAPSMFQCKRVEGEDPNFCMVGSLYETTTLEDPEIVSSAQKKIEVCTELQSCGFAGESGPYVCDHPSEGTEPPRKKYAITKIRMGDITGPCGNTNCSLAHKVKNYIRNLDSYKGKIAAAGIVDKKPQTSKKVCGSCVCHDDRYHRIDCPERIEEGKTKCKGCQGVAKLGDTCEDRKQKLYDTGATPKSSLYKINYVTKVPDFKDAMFGRDYIVEDCFSTSYTSKANISNWASTSHDASRVPTVGCGCRNPESSKCNFKSTDSKYIIVSKGTSTPMIYNVEATNTPNPLNANVGTNVYNAEIKDSRRRTQVFYAEGHPLAEDKACMCNPVKPIPPCLTNDCDCMTEALNVLARKTHRPYCPAYKHKNTCPVTMMHEEEEQKKLDDDEDETAPLPYGLPPIQLGPCPILGRPCSVPDGFARMYKNAVLPMTDYSYGEEGKVCCSREYERIKRAIRDYTKRQKESDYRCVNKFNVDTERRCCDKEQILMSLMGKGCCGSHKIAIQDKFKQENKDNQEKQEKQEKPEKQQ